MKKFTKYPSRYIRSSRYIRASFSPSMPSWLKKELSRSGWDSTRFKDALLRNNVKLDTVEFLDQDPGNAIPVYLIQDDYNQHAYTPGCVLTLYVNGRSRDASKLGKKTLNDLIVDVVFIDRNNPNNFDDDEHYKDPRYITDRDRLGFSNYYYGGQYKKFDGTWSERGQLGRNELSSRDKSGYKVPSPEEKIKDYYMRFPEKMTSKIDSLYDDIIELQQDIFSPERINDPNTGSDYGNAMYRLRDAIDAYKRLLKIIDRETGEFKDRGWGSSYKSADFSDAVNEVRNSIKRAKENLVSKW